MRSLKWNIALSILLFATIHCALANSVSPLAKYSASWNDPYYNVASNNSIAAFLSEEEKILIQIINLARRNPRLFSETVLLPYARKNGFYVEIMTAINQMNNPTPKRMLLVERYYTKKARIWIKAESMKQFTGSNNAEIINTGNEPVLKNTVLFFGNYSDQVDLVCKMITAPTNKNHSLSKFIIGDYSIAGLAIRKNTDNNAVVAMVFENLTIQQQLNLPHSSNWYINDYTDENYQPLNIIQSPGDSLMNYFKKQSSFIDNNAVFVDSDEFDQLADRLNKLDIKIIKNENLFSINIKNTKTIILRNKNPIFYDYTKFNAELSTGFSEPETAFNYYYVGRTTIDEVNIIKVCVKQLYNQPILPLLPPDSIGKLEIDPDFSAIYNLTRITSDKSLPSLARELCTPWKKDMEKVRSIYSWMRHNISYDYSSLYSKNYTTEVKDVLNKRVGVCEGYANLFNALCKEAHIESVRILGRAKTKSDPTGYAGHAWNAVRIENKWYLVDVTWGDRYFLSSPEYFFKDHFPDASRWTLLQTRRTFDDFMANPENNP